MDASRGRGPFVGSAVIVSTGGGGRERECPADAMDAFGVYQVSVSPLGDILSKWPWFSLSLPPSCPVGKAGSWRIRSVHRGRLSSMT